MKNHLLVFFLFLGILSSKAQTISLTGLSYDDENDYYYFDVKVEGEYLYMGYGADVQLPTGLVCVKNDSDNPRIRRVAGLYPKNDDDEYYHTISSAFPDPSDLTHVRVACFSTSNKKFKAATGTLFRVCVRRTCTSTQWPIGEIKAYDVELNVDAETRYYVDATKNVAMFEGTSTLPLNISASSHWSTCILPFSTDLPGDVKAYTSSTSDEKNIFLTPAASLAAYTPYVLYSEAGFSGTVTGIVAETGYPETGYVTAGNLNGAVVPQTVNNGYIMQKQNGEVMFYAIGSGDSFLVPAGKCWMQIPDGGSAKAYNFVVADETGVESQIAPVDNSDKVYDLTGRRITHLRQNTLYIKDGKKFINK